MSSEQKITVAIADDNRAIRDGVRKMLEYAPDIEVVGEACNGQEALEIVKKMAPDVLILDLLMPVMDGITVIEILRRLKFDTSVLVLSAIDDPVFKEESLLRGACSYLTKDQAIRLTDRVKDVARGVCEDSGAGPGSKPKNYAAIY